jgi:hypothetical protein
MRYPGKLTYFYEKLGQAIVSAMFCDTPDRMADVFNFLQRAIDNEQRTNANAAFLQDPASRNWFETIVKLIEPSAEDLVHPKGGFFARASRMSLDEKIELNRVVWDLHQYVGAFEGELEPQTLKH